MQWERSNPASQEGRIRPRQKALASRSALAPWSLAHSERPTASLVRGGSYPLAELCFIPMGLQHQTLLFLVFSSYEIWAVCMGSDSGRWNRPGRGHPPATRSFSWVRPHGGLVLWRTRLELLQLPQDHISNHKECTNAELSFSLLLSFIKGECGFSESSQPHTEM